MGHPRPRRRRGAHRPHGRLTRLRRVRSALRPRVQAATVVRAGGLSSADTTTATTASSATAVERTGPFDVTVTDAYGGQTCCLGNAPADQGPPSITHSGAARAAISALSAGPSHRHGRGGLSGLLEAMTSPISAWSLDVSVYTCPTHEVVSVRPKSKPPRGRSRPARDAHSQTCSSLVEAEPRHRAR